MNFHVSSCRMMTSVMGKAYVNSADRFLSASASLPPKKIAFCLYIYINFSSAPCISVCRDNSQLKWLWVSPASFNTSLKMDLLWWEKDLQNRDFDPCLRFVVSWHFVRASFQLAPSKYHQKHLYGHLSPRKSSPRAQQLQQQSPGKAQRGPCFTISSSTSLLSNSHRSYKGC